MNEKVELSIVIPVYNSADIFPELYNRILAALTHVVTGFEIIAVLDGCKDRSFDVIANYCTSDKRVKVIDFSRNFGHQAAISAGLLAASGDMIAVMDDDLEDPPEVLVEMLQKVREGFDVVYGVRKKRKRSIAYRYLYGLFYRLIGRLADIEMPYDAGDFSIMQRHVVKVLNSMPERNRFIRGLRAWSGFRQSGVEYKRDRRFANESGYSLRKYIALALDAIFSFSYKPLKFVSFAGITIALASFIYGATLVVQKLLGKIADVPGWASMVVSMLFISGIQLLAIGVIGEYIARIYDEVKQRPKYIVRKTIGLTEKESDDRHP